MRTIVYNEIPLISPLRLNDYHYNGDNIVAYHTAGSTGWAILQGLGIGAGEFDQFGFFYLRDILQGKRPSSKYRAFTRISAIRNVIKDDKVVYYFNNMNDFLENQHHYDD